jgi:hypothetical protein
MGKTLANESKDEENASESSKKQKNKKTSHHKDKEYGFIPKPRKV